MAMNLKGIPLEELEELFSGLGHSPYRARQLFLWLYQKRARQFDEMTDLSKAFRAELNANFSVASLKIHESQHSKDGTIKFLIELADGHHVESVYIPTEGRNTLCVSTQVGCKMACTFCATGYQGFQRNLKAWEIVDQLMVVNVPGKITNIVLMGMGEPLDNYPEVRKALKIFQHPCGFQIGKRHITLSTVGLTPKIQEFVSDNLGQLAISLHGTTESQRSEIMPISRKYPLPDLMQACRKLKFQGTRRVTFEYLLIKDFNDSLDDAKRLLRLLTGVPCKVNLLAYNENEFTEFKRPSEDRVLRFQRYLLEKNLTVTYRKSRGRDIAAACGQLRTALKPALLAKVGTDARVARHHRL